MIPEIRCLKTSINAHLIYCFRQVVEILAPVFIALFLKGAKVAKTNTAVRSDAIKRDFFRRQKAQEIGAGHIKETCGLSGGGADSTVTPGL